MAKKQPAKKSVNKSAMIRELAAGSAGKDATTILEQAAAKGVKLSKPLIYQVLGKASAKKKKAKGIRLPKDVTLNGSVIGPLGEFLAAVKSVGGLQQARELIEALETFQK